MIVIINKQQGFEKEKSQWGFLAFSFAGSNLIRFKGYDLSPPMGTPLKSI